MGGAASWPGRERAATEKSCLEVRGKSGEVNEENKYWPIKKIKWPIKKINIEQCETGRCNAYPLSKRSNSKEVYFVPVLSLKSRIFWR